MTQDYLVGRRVEFTRDDEVVVGYIKACDVSQNVYTVDVNEKCFQIDATNTSLKAEFEPGELNESIVQRLIGSRLDVAMPTRSENGVLKQFNQDEKCSLIRFDNGNKEWIDLSQHKVFVYLVKDKKENNSTMQEIEEQCSRPITKDLPIPTAAMNNIGEPIHLYEATVNSTDACGWYQEGNNIELYDLPHIFKEGSIICSSPNLAKGELKLYNEARGTFDINIKSQPHKVVLHGFNSLKEIPVDQVIEVYSVLKGNFRTGSNLKKAERGKLIPILFDDSKSLEWIDLSSQTFKIVCFPDLNRPLSARERERYLSSAKQPTSIKLEENQNQEAQLGNLSIDGGFHFPQLPEGTRIDIYDSKDGEYCKCYVTRKLAHEPYSYEVRAQVSSTRFVVDISAMRCKVLLRDFNGLDIFSLVTHVIEVYIKDEKRVEAGRVCGGNNQDRMVHVRYQGGRKEWVSLKTTKLKIRLHGMKTLDTSFFTNVASPSPAEHQAMGAHDRRYFQRSHSYSEVPSQNPPSPHPFRRSSSANKMLQQTPLSPLRRIKMYPNVIAKIQSLHKLVRKDSLDSMDNCSIDSARSIESISEIEADPHSEWRMQIDPKTKQTYYVHLPTGSSQWHPPPNINIHALQWIATEELENNMNLETKHQNQVPVGAVEAIRHSRSTTNVD